MLVWIGRASADTSSTAAVSTSVSNVATGRADAVNAADFACTPAVSFTAMPGMSETFSFGGAASRPVLVLFQAEWRSFGEGSVASIRLMIDGIVQPASTLSVDHRVPGNGDEIETHGFNFVSDPLAPGTHTATIQWSATGTLCATDRSLIVLHK
jgi:hypothetical protein